MTTTMRPTEELLDALPPSDLDAEAAVIGSVFRDQNVLDDVVLLAGPEDFYLEQHRVIFGHLLSMHNAGQRIDAKLFAAHVRKAGGELVRFEPGETYHPQSVDMIVLAEAIQSTVTAANAEHYAGIVREQAIRRELRNAGSSIISTAHNERDGNAALDQCERLILEIRDRRGNLSSHSSSIAEVMQNAMSDIAQRGTDRLPWTTTGFADLDKYMGFRRSELTILAARPSMGKTALALNFATNAAMGGKPVVFFSLEMDQLQVADRIIASQAELDGHRLRSGQLTDSDRRSIVEIAAEISRIPLHIDDSPSQNMQSISAVCRRQKRKHGLSLVIVDYLQLISPDSSRDPREQQVAKISKRLKGLARELEVPVVCLAQLNRQAESSTNNRPRLSHLRESGAIEQDADVVCFVHRPEYYAADQETKTKLKGQAEIYVEKNRNGRTGVVPLVWLEHIVTFRARAAEHYANYEPSFENF